MNGFDLTMFFMFMSLSAFYSKSVQRVSKSHLGVYSQGALSNYL